MPYFRDSAGAGARASAGARGWQVLKYGVLLPPVLTTLELVWIWTGIAVGIFCKVLDYRHILAGDMLGFERSHFWWHVSLPFFFGSYTLYLWFVKAQAC